MTDKLTVFTYNKLPVSVIQDDAGEPWWIIKEVCKVLNIADPTSAVRNLADDEKLLRSLCGTGGQRRDVITVNEPGLYRLIMRSNKKEAREFQHWVLHEVLPSIRKNGYYGTKPDRTDEILSAINKQNETMLLLVQNLIQTKPQEPAKAIPCVGEEKALPPIVEGKPRANGIEKLGRDNPVYHRFKSQWNCVTHFQKVMLADKVSFETCRRVIYDGRTNVAPVLFYEICNALGFTRQEIVRLMTDYGYINFVEILEGKAA